MTINGNFKKVVRARMAATGENYTKARQYLLDHRPTREDPPAASKEPVDLLIGEKK